MNGSSRAALAAALVAAALAAGAAPTWSAASAPSSSAPSETLLPLLQQVMPTMPGKTLTAVQVTFPPGARSTPHRHGSAFLFAYVLSGAVLSQIEGEPVQTFRAGQSWTEKPGDHHVRTDNASSSEPAVLLVVFVAETGDALKTDDPKDNPKDDAKTEP